MPRKPLIRSGEWPYHVTARCNNREPFPCPLKEVWKCITLELFIQTIIHDLKVHAFVLMPNHFHLILTVPSGEIDICMKRLMESSTRIINVRTQRSGHLYGGRYYWSIIKNPIYFAHAMKYVFRNPVKAYIVQTAEDYSYSTLSAIFGKSEPAIPITIPIDGIGSRIPSDPWEFKAWVDTPYSQEEAEAIRKAFRRKEFTLPINRISRKPLEIENQI